MRLRVNTFMFDLQIQEMLAARKTRTREALALMWCAGQLPDKNLAWGLKGKNCKYLIHVMGFHMKSRGTMLASLTKETAAIFVIKTCLSQIIM